MDDELPVLDFEVLYFNAVPTGWLPPAGDDNDHMLLPVDGFDLELLGQFRASLVGAGV